MEHRKIYRSSQMKDVVGHGIGGLDMHKYGMPYRNAARHVHPFDTDLVDLMLLAVSRFPEIHVMTHFNDGRVLNYYETKDARVYYLHAGNADPDIEFSTEFRLDDWTLEELEESYRASEEFRNRPLDPVETAAVNFAIHAVLTKKVG